MANRDTLFEVAHFPPSVPPMRETVERLQTLEVWRRASVTIAVTVAGLIPVSLADRMPFTVGVASAAMFAAVLAVVTSVAREVLLRGLTIHPEFAGLPAVAGKHRRLLSPRGRRRLARELRQTAALNRPRSRPGLVVVPVLFDRLAAVRPQLLELAAGLEANRDLDTTSVAILRELLRDGRSPLYNPNVPAEELHAVLTHALVSLPPTEQSPDTRTNPAEHTRLHIPAGLPRMTFCVGVVLIVVGCGASSSTKPAKPQQAPGTPGQRPSALLGTYTTTLKPTDLSPHPPRELTDGSRTWELTITKSGGGNGGHAFTIANAKLGEFESSPFRIEGDTITLSGEECNAGGSVNLYDNKYSYTLTGQTLTFTPVTNRCSDQVSRTILTSEPWKKTG